MTAHVPILPANATPLESALAEACDPHAALRDEYDGMALALRQYPIQFAPWRIWELGLGVLTPFVPNLFQRIDECVAWQRVRGTFEAIDRALSWLGYAGEVEEETERRLRWNRFQLALDRVRDQDIPDLRQINGVVPLSVPKRSRFYRGFHGHDVRAAEASYQRFSASIFSSHSGVRIEDGKAKWSFGRNHEADRQLTEAELTALGTWIAEVPEGGTWAEATYPWSDASFPWTQPAAQSRRTTIATALDQMGWHVRFRGVDDTIIGHAFAAAHPVREMFGGCYAFGGTEIGVDRDEPRAFYVQCRTIFGGGAGNTAAKMSLIADGVSTIGPGALWLGPAELTGGTEIAETAIDFPFGLTVRETCQFLLRF